MSSTFAIAYEDYVQRGDWSTVDFPSGQTASTGSGSKILLGEFANLSDIRLGVVAGGLTVGGTAGSVHQVTYTNVWDTGYGNTDPVQIISLLDVRRGGGGEVSFTIDVNRIAGVIPTTVSFTVASYPTSDFPRHIHIMLPAALNSSGIQVVLTQTGSDCFFTVGRIWAGPLWLPEDGITNDWSSSIIDPGKMERSRGGQGYPVLRQRVRGLDMNLSSINYESAFGLPDNSVLDLQQLGFRLGTTGTLIAFPRTRDSAGDIDDHSIHRNGVYGHLAEPMVIRHVNGPFFDTRLRIEELL
jgi:hypothetical protein